MEVVAKSLDIHSNDHIAASVENGDYLLLW